jgi:hypothetical protein
VKDWRPFRALSFYAKVESDAPVEMRIIGLDDRRPRGILRRFTLEPGDWREVVLPLPDWRPDLYDQIGDFARIDRLLIRWDKGAGAVTVDDFRLLPGKRGDASCRPTVEERLALAFPKGGGKAVEGEHFVLLTDVRRLQGADGKKLLARLEEGLALLRNRWGLDGDLSSKVPLVVCANDADYRAFFPRYGAHLGVKVPPPDGDGLALLGVAASSYDPKQGWERRVYAGIAAKAAIEQLLGVAANGNWLSAGLSGAVQATLYPKTIEGVDVAAIRVPFDDLFFTRRPGGARVLQLISIFDYLAETYRPRLPALWAKVRETTKPLNESVPPAMAAVLELSLADLEKDWTAWLAKKR